MADAPSTITAIAKAQLLSIIERVESVQTEIDDLNDDKSEIFKEAKGNGFRTKTIKSIIKLRAADPIEKEEDDAFLDLYLTALGMAPKEAVRARVENIELLATNSVRDSDAAPLSRSERSQLAPAGDVSEEARQLHSSAVTSSLDADQLPEAVKPEALHSNHAHLPNTAGVKTDESASPSDSSVAISEPDAGVEPSSATPDSPEPAEEGTQNQSVRTATTKVGKQSGGKLPVPPIDPHRFGSHVRATPAEMPDMPKWLSEQIDARHKARTTSIEGNKV